MNKPTSISIATLSCLLILVTFFFMSCDDKESNLPVTDFFKFKLSDKERIYEFKDSVVQICDVSRYDKGKFDFYGLKLYESDDVEFPSLAFNIVKDSASSCPEIQFNEKSYFYVTLSKLTKDNYFIDYESFERNISKDFKINQKVIDGKIVLTGTFSGWLYQLYPRRPEGQIIEPRRIDSLFIPDASFQFTSK